MVAVSLKKKTENKKRGADREKNEEEYVEERFLNACRGWIKYKPLYSYITDGENYCKNMQKIQKCLNDSIVKINDIFHYKDFKVVLEDFNIYHTRVEEDYKKYLETNEIWNKLKFNI